MPFPSRRRMLTLATAITPPPPPVSGAANMQMNPLKNGIVGTWRMVEATALRDTGHGPAHPQRRRRRRRTNDGGPVRRPEDVADGTARDYSSYRGNDTFDGQTLVTRVDASGSPRNAIGGDQVRQVRFEGKRMVFVPSPAMVDGVMRHREIYWERISALPV